MPEIEEKDPTRERAAALYTFLKEFTELRSKTTRTVDQYEDVLWFSDIPREPECECAAWHRGQDDESDEVWLTIRQPRLFPVRKPPADLEPWLSPGQVDDSSLEMPELREEISFPIQDASGEQRFERRIITEWPAIRAAWERYVEKEWWPWAEADRRAQSVQRVYTQLFSIYQKQQRLGEQYEAVLGLGLLFWRTPDSQEVRRHLLTASTNISFDAARGIMTVGPAGEGARPQIEQDMLDPAYRPDPEEQSALSSQAKEVGERLWDPAPVDAILAGWARSVSSKGVYDYSLSRPVAVLPDPMVTLAPALILRKRTERSFVRAFEEIIREIKAGAPIPPGVSRFVTVIEDPKSLEDQDRSDSKAGNTTAELYFPLEWNEAQRQIVERISRHQGVLVQGPPGTGKSHTIVNLICHLLASGNRVLVTSHTARALKVLQRYIRDRVAELSPLAVVLLGDDRDALQTMEESVQGITHRHNHWDPNANLRQITDLEVRLDEACRDEARVLSDLRAIRERETYDHPVRFGVYGGTLQAIATRLHQEESIFGWIEDRPANEQEPPLSTEEFQELVLLLRDPQLDEWHSMKVVALDSQALPLPDSVANHFATEARARAAYESVSKIRGHPHYSCLFHANPDTRQKLAKELSDLLEVIDHTRRHLHAWAERAVREILGDHDRAWRELLEVTKEHLSFIGDRGRWADVTPVAGLGERDRHEVRADAEAMFTHLAKGGSWGIGPFRAATAKRAQYIRREMKIEGHAIESPEHLTSLISWLDVETRIAVLRERWASFHSVDPRSAFSVQLRHFEDLCEPLDAALTLHERKARLRTLIHSIPGLSEPTWHELDSLRSLRDCLGAVNHELRFHASEFQLSLIRGKIQSLVSTDNVDPAGHDLVQALAARNIGAYRDAYSRASRNEERSRNSKRRANLLAALNDSAHILADQLARTSRDESWDLRASQFGTAWNWVRAKSWLERLCDPRAEQQLLLQLDSARARIRNRLKEIAAEKAWAHCFTRMTEHQRQHLIAWSKAVRSIGKGTGKYAALHRRNAQEHMNECRSAIPAWIMPLYRIAETIKPGTDLFDVVIIDEASQSGPEALLLAYLAKKLVVVGDDKQISPTYAGTNFEDVIHLRARYLADVPHRDSYGVDQSFFDLAEIRYQGRIRLREHFRCMPEIIQFSNNLCYASEPLIPLRQYGGSRLTPVVCARHVPDGYLKGSGQHVINPPETQAIVDMILSMHTDDAYKGKTFGVISLLGDPQAREIERLLLNKLGPQEMEKRQLVCGDAYAFQGDERDVILLSLVSAPSEGRRIHPLTDEPARRRFNVAASRARDQMILFHTATVSDLSPKCFRHALLQYCQNPAVERVEVTGRPIADLQHLAATADRDRLPPPEPFESWFELDVFLRISAQGFRVVPQHEIAGYRIDLVVDGMARRVAVECDGDRWHGPERYEEDMARQRMLERCGWKFWRVRGGAFSLNPESALESLWGTLEREGVYPYGKEPGPQDGTRFGDVSLHTSDVESQDLGSESDSITPSEVQSPSDFRLEPQHSDMPNRRLKPAADPAEQPEYELLPSRGGHDLADAPYTAWTASTPLPDPTEAQPSDVIAGLVEIVGIEGPISVERLCRIFVKGAGRQRVGRQARSTLSKALWRAIREGYLQERNETGQSGLKEHILRKVNSPHVVVRPRGDRELIEVPPSEVATVMCRLEQRAGGLSGPALYRPVLDFYETRRMTTNIQQRLEWIFERRNELSAIEDPNLRDTIQPGSQ